MQTTRASQGFFMILYIKIKETKSIVMQMIKYD